MMNASLSRLFSQRGPHIMRILGAMAFVLAWSLDLVAARAAACGHDGLVITGTADETADACRALSKVLDRFEAYGHSIQPAFSLSFEPHVSIDLLNASDGSVTETVEVSGYYDNRRDAIHVASGSRRSDKTRAPWGIEWSQPIASSILEHELAHAVMADLLGPDYNRVGRAHHENVAYVIQFDVMDPALRSRILSTHPTVDAFPGREAVNGVAHDIDPEAFGIRAYRFSQTEDGELLVRQVLGRQVGLGDEVDTLWTE
jgi:hypothetical protein